MPLTYAQTEAPADERRRRARKIKPQLAEGRLVKAAGARNQAEAEFLQGLLLEEGVPSTLRRSAGFDVPDFLAAGPRDVLLQADLEAKLPSSSVDAPARVLLYLLAACAVVALIAWLFF